jgi:hypothetical protein
VERRADATLALASFVAHNFVDNLDDDQIHP